MTHPGTPTDGDREAGLQRVARVDETRRCPKFTSWCCSKPRPARATASDIASKIACILDLVKNPDRLGVLPRHCHVFAAGYPLAPLACYEATMAEFDRVIGLSKLRAGHLNDDLKPLGSQVDRHAHIGQGCLGLNRSGSCCTIRVFRTSDDSGNTQGRTNDEDMDPVNLKTLRDLQNRVTSPVRAPGRADADPGGAILTASASDDLTCAASELVEPCISSELRRFR